MTFEEFKAFIDGGSYPDAWRYGQAAFNGLYQIRPDLAEQIRATTLDPFHRDDVVPEFYKWVEEHW